MQANTLASPPAERIPGFQRTPGSFGRRSLQPNGGYRHLSEAAAARGSSCKRLADWGLFLPIHYFGPQPCSPGFTGEGARLCGVADRQRLPGPLTLVMDVALQLLDRLLLLLDDRLHQVTDRHHPHHLAAIHHRKVAHPALGHEMHAVLHGLIG